MSMSRKDYRAAAEIIAHEVTGGHPLLADKMLTRHDIDNDDASSAIYVIACGLATMFKIDNSNFNRSQFMKACHIEE